MTQRTCKLCPQPIPEGRPKQTRYCSPKCASKSHVDGVKPCTIDGCERKVRARGLCVNHYNAKHQKKRHAKVLMACAWCGKETLKGSGGGRKYGAVCSLECRQWLATPHCTLPADHWARWYGAASVWPKPVSAAILALRSPMRAAYEDGDHASMLAAIKSHSDMSPSGCWEWNRSLKDGYPVVLFGKRWKQVHRLSIEAATGKELGKQAAHHKCANTKCVNPDHLQPVTHRENTAEMLERSYYVARIHELEAALRQAEPRHPLLNQISIPEAS